MTISDQIANSDVFSGTPAPGQNVVRVKRPAAPEPAAPETANNPPAQNDIGSPPSCGTNLDLNNSIAIRRALLRDAFFFLPKAGFFGFGLDLFLKLSCFQGYQIYNSILQTIVEFGWIAGLAIMVLVAISLKQFLWGDHEFGINLQFLLSCIAFTTLLSLTYGQISRELTLFLFLGAFAKASSRPANVDGCQVNGPASA